MIDHGGHPVRAAVVDFAFILPTRNDRTSSGFVGLALFRCMPSAAVNIRAVNNSNPMNAKHYDSLMIALASYIFANGMIASNHPPEQR